MIFGRQITVVKAEVKCEFGLRPGVHVPGPTYIGVGWRSGGSLDCEPGDPGSISSRTRDMSGHAPDVVSLGKALDTTFLTPPRCEWPSSLRLLNPDRKLRECKIAEGNFCSDSSGECVMLPPLCLC
ncbi:hypothetical protein Bbelb_085580 [Branchiostoma belcheri]|nr:hypothetical protein Bbelb_085580 [Branchiostoma belcheri]